MAGAVGTDTLGEYFSGSLSQAGVQVLVDPDLMAHTGTVMVLTTPDAHRSFLSFFDSGAVRMTPSMARAIRASRMVVIEGYMLELPGAEQWVGEVARMARGCGAHVVLTAGDPGVVQRHRAALRGLLDGGLVDVLFCNREEACELLACCQESKAEAGGWGGADGAVCDGAAAAAALGGFVPVAVVTDGARGSHISCLGELHSLGCAPVGGCGPVDVCGAGDAYAAGVLYAITQGHDLRTAGAFGAKVAGAVICRHGAQLAEEDACALVNHLPNHVLLPHHWPASSAAQLS
jgi:sugar/nucleoside kinase (ribokinase family)